MMRNKQKIFFKSWHVMEDATLYFSPIKSVGVGYTINMTAVNVHERDGVLYYTTK